MNTRYTTNDQRYYTSTQLQKSIADGESNYYFFFGNHDPSVTSTPDANSDLYSTIEDTYNNMIAGKRITQDNILPAIRNIPYISNTVYDRYDDKDGNLSEKNFFVITNEGSFNHVYKCLDNNMGNPSTAQPQFSEVQGSNSFIYQTSDGYRWKYMYSVDSGTILKFETSDYFPVVANTQVADQASGGCVDVIAIEGTGQKYDNYTEGTFSTAQIKVGGNNILYQISNTSLSFITNFYSGCLVYLSTGIGAGSYATVESYSTNSSGSYIILDNAFEVSPTNGTQYQIYPKVNVYGTGPALVNCVARALVNSLSTNSIYRVEILNRGSGYNVIYSANVMADPSVSIFLPAELRPINSPPRGHGFNAAQELFSNSIMISIKISNTENNTIPSSNFYQQIGILKDPLFANVSIEFLNNIGKFEIGEIAYALKTIKLQNNASVNTTSNTINCVDADFVNQIANDTQVLIQSGDMSTYQLCQIDSVTNSSQIILKANAFFACTSTLVYKVSTTASGVVIGSNNTNLLLSNVQGYFTKNDQFLGNSTGSYTQVNSIMISDVSKGLDTFVESYKYNATTISGELQPNEYINQTNGFTFVTTSALVHSVNTVGSNVTLYTTKQQDNFVVGGANTAVGNTTGAEVQLNSTYPPELVFGTGSVIYFENIGQIPRSNVTSETFQFTISF